MHFKCIFSSKLLVLFWRITNGIDVCNALSDKTDGLFDYGIQLMDSNVNVSDVKDKNLVFIGEHYWEVDINGDFVKISHLQSSISGDFSGTFQMGFYYLYLSHYYKPEPKYCNYIGLFDVMRIFFFPHFVFLVSKYFLFKFILFEKNI
jgi:hypothetical protein